MSTVKQKVIAFACDGDFIGERLVVERHIARDGLVLVVEYAIRDAMREWSWREESRHPYRDGDPGGASAAVRLLARAYRAEIESFATAEWLVLP